MYQALHKFIQILILSNLLLEARNAKPHALDFTAVTINIKCSALLTSSNPDHSGQFELYKDCEIK
jgi:hypothetical protein